MNEEANNDPIGRALNLTPYENTAETVKNIIAEAHNDSAKVDFETARSNVLDIIDNGTDALHKLLAIANSSQHPRAFEVYAKLMDSLIAANEKLLDLQTKIREIDTADAPLSDKAKTINNNLFVGSTAELQKMIEGMKNGGQS